MKIASEKVWATKKGELVPDGDPDALVLVASKGHPISEKTLAKFSASDVKKFFQPPNFDDEGKHQPNMTMEVTAPRTFSRVDAGPQPDSREGDMPQISRRHVWQELEIREAHHRGKKAKKTAKK